MYIYMQGVIKVFPILKKYYIHSEKIYRILR